MSINTFKLDGIDAILNKHLQPWADSNNRPDSSYRELLSKTPEIPMQRNWDSDSATNATSCLPIECATIAD
jgi:hypothetical protein